MFVVSPEPALWRDNKRYVDKPDFVAVVSQEGVRSRTQSDCLLLLNPKGWRSDDATPTFWIC